MLFAIDIDGTLAYLNTIVYKEICAELFELQIDAQTLEAITYQDFLALPEIVARHHEAAWLPFHPRVLREAPVIPGAVEGVRRLTEIGTVAYYTARFSRNNKKHGEMVEATQEWLATHGFPDVPVVHCDAIPGKLAALGKLIQETGEQVALIDDSYERILLRLAELPAEIVSVVRSGMALVALRAKAAPVEAYGIRFVPLRNWHYIEAFVKEYCEPVHRCSSSAYDKTTGNEHELNNRVLPI